MNVIDSIKNIFRRGGAKMGVVSTLNKITDHPRIGVSSKEYDRIQDNLKFFEGQWPDVAYKNTYGVMKHRPYTALNMAQVAAKRLASILVNEQMKVSIGNNNKAAQEFVEALFANNDFLKNFERYLESGLALGGLAMRPYFDEAKQMVKIAFIQAPVFFPLQSNVNDVSEAAIAIRSTTTEGQKPIYWTLLEFHSWDGDKYVIDNELYRSEDSSVVGIPQTLSANPAYADLQPHAEIDNLTRPMFVYMKPFGFNNKDLTSPLGLSIYDNAKDTLRQLNDTYDQFHWEVKMGQRRVMVPESMTSVTDMSDGTLRQFFDTDQNMFLGTNAEMDATSIKDLTTAIRANDYITAMNQFLKVYEMQVGLSTGTFSFDGQGLKTATEVVSENSMTYQTRNSHLNNVERAIKELIVSAMELAQSMGAYSGEVPTLQEIELNFDDGVFLDKNAQLDYFTKMNIAGFASKKQAIMTLNDVDEKRAEQILAEIAAESQPEFDGNDANMYRQTGDDE